MSILSVTLHDVSIRSSGFGGGFIYIFGRADYESHGEIDVYGYFYGSTEEYNSAEKEFKKNYTGGDLTLTSSEWKYLKGVGLEMKSIQWKST